MKFKYRKTSISSPFSERKTLVRPIIPISLKSGERSLRYEALIDSGADLADQTGILGQYGFFDKFIVKFDLRKEDIEIKGRI